MKIAISSTDKSVESSVSDIFGRCPFFIICEIKDGKAEKTEAIENKSLDQNSGAGVSTSQLIVENGVEAVVSGSVGPRALEVLKQFNVEVYSGQGIVKNVLQEFIDGKLKKIS